MSRPTPPPPRSDSRRTSVDVDFVRDVHYRKRVPMTPAMIRAFGKAVPRARQLGVSFKPGEVHFWAFMGQEHEPFGITYHTHHPVEVYLNLTRGHNFTDREWGELIAHELQHCFDARYPSMTTAEREERAYAFAARVMEGIE